MPSSRLLRGAFAGFLATVPMTVCMLIVRRGLPRHEQHRLPPVQITAHLTRTTGLRKLLDRQGEGVLGWVLHFGFGTAAGAIFGGLSPRLPLPDWLQGLAFGVVVWAGSYFGWLPAFDIHGHGGDQPPRRNALMLAAHLVWGVTLGAVTDALTGRRATGG
jgi:uncharacterized membrane protein YagU involved in acid resistance